MDRKQGAEATIEIEENKVLKRRYPKEYRHPDLDSKIIKERTDTEVRLLEDARRHNVNVPKAEKTDESTIEMEEIEGDILKEIIENRTGLMKDFGKNMAFLHSTDIIHGDLTTSNAMATKEELFLIDFGLAFRSQRIEDKAVDIHLLKQVLNSSHPEIAGKAWEFFVEGYSKYERSDEVLEQLKDVEKRGRYK